MSVGRLTSWRGRPEVLLGWVGTAVVVASVYAAVTALGALVTPDTHSSMQPSMQQAMLPALVATVIVAAVIGPVQRRCEQRASRLLHGERTPPYESMRRFASLLEQCPDPEQLPHRMARLLAEGTGAAWAQVWVLVNGQPQLVAAHPPEVRGDPEPPTGAPPRAGDSVRWVAVGHEGSPLGVLRVQLRPGEVMTPVEERLFAGLAAQAGLALHAAQLRAELVARHDELSRRAIELRLARDRIVSSQDSERRRLERDIHDGAQQQLVALGINLRLAQTLSGRSPERARGILVEQAAAAAAALETVGSLSRGARPRVLLEQGLLPAFGEVAETAPLELVVSGERHRRLAPELEATLYFCGLEAVQNAVKHSGASRVAVHLEVHDDTARLSVSDDGRGFGAGTATGSGLHNMQQRLREVGGALRIDSGPAPGTTVVAEVPLMAGVGA